MFYLVESSKSFAEVVFDLEPVVQRLGFVLLNTCDLGEMLHRKGIELDEDCQIFDVCNYRYAEKILTSQIALGLTVPWRISVFTDNGATKIGLLRPAAFLSAADQPAALLRLAAEIEEKLKLIVDEAR